MIEARISERQRITMEQVTTASVFGEAIQILGEYISLRATRGRAMCTKGPWWLTPNTKNWSRRMPRWQELEATLAQVEDLKVRLAEVEALIHNRAD